MWGAKGYETMGGGDDDDDDDDNDDDDDTHMKADKSRHESRHIRAHIWEHTCESTYIWEHNGSTHMKAHI